MDDERFWSIWRILRKLGPDFDNRKYFETKCINFRFSHGRFVSILSVKVSGLKKWLILWILDSLRRKRDFFFFFLVDLDYIYGRLLRIWRVFIRYINYLKILILELNDGQFTNFRSIYENTLDTIITWPYRWFCVMKHFQYQRNWRQKLWYSWRKLGLY